MSQQIIDISTPDDGLGDVLRNGFDKANQNFTELYNGKVDKITGKGLSENNFTNADKDKLDGIESGAEVNVQADWGETDPTSDSFILNKPPSLYSAFGYFYVADLATQTTPLAFVVSTPLQLTNDGGGAFTNYAQAPYGVSDIWDNSRNQFAFEKLSVGDAVLVRTDLLISTTSINQNLRLYIKLGIGTPSEYDLLIDSWNERIVVTFEKFIKDVSFSIDNEDWRTAPAKIYILSDDNGSVKVNGWYIPIIRKSLNIIDFNSDPLKLDKDTTAGVERAYIVNADGSQGTKATSEFKDVLEFANSGAFPATGKSGKIYVALDTNLQYRWSGSAYVQLSSGIDFPSDGKTYGVKDGLAVDLGINIAKDFPNSIIIQASGAGVSYVGTYASTFTGTQSDILVGDSGVAYRKVLSASTAGSNANMYDAGVYRVQPGAGFYYRERIKNEDATNITTGRFSYGFSGTAIIGNRNPSTYTQTLLSLAADNTDANCQIMYKNASGTATKIDLGATMPKTQSDEYVIEFLRFKGTTTIYYKITNLTTGVVVMNSFTFALNALALGNFRNNETVASACGFALRRAELYITD